LITDIRQALGKRDPYRLAVLEAANAVIPRGARVILAGHSLGGMVAESVAATPIFQQNYRAQQVITFGSPKVPGADLVGTRYQRFAAVGDPVPNLTLSPDGRPGDHILVRNTLRNPLDSIAKGGPLAAHLAYPDIPDLERYNVGCLDWSMSWDFPVPAL
jgi:pimeloyl-ACP methyl ester carboxylesterase